MKKELNPKGMREQIASRDEFVILSLRDQNILSDIVSDLSPYWYLCSSPSHHSCLSHSLLFLLSCPSCPNTSLLFYSLSSWILFHSFFAVPGIVLIVIVEIKSRVLGPAMDTNPHTNRWFEFVVVVQVWASLFRATDYYVLIRAFSVIFSLYCCGT